MNNKISIESLKKGNIQNVVSVSTLRITKIVLVARSCAMVLFVLNIIIFLISKKKKREIKIKAIVSTIIFGVTCIMNKFYDFFADFTPNLSNKYYIRIILEILFFVIQLIIFIKLIINLIKNKKKEEP